MFYGVISPPIMPSSTTLEPFSTTWCFTISAFLTLSHSLCFQLLVLLQLFSFAWSWLPHHLHQNPHPLLIINTILSFIITHHATTCSPVYLTRMQGRWLRNCRSGSNASRRRTSWEDLPIVGYGRFTSACTRYRDTNPYCKEKQGAKQRKESLKERQQQSQIPQIHLLVHLTPLQALLLAYHAFVTWHRRGHEFETTCTSITGLVATRSVRLCPRCTLVLFVMKFKMSLWCSC